MADHQRSVEISPDLLDPYSSKLPRADYTHGGPSPLTDFLGQKLARFDGLGCAEGPVQLLESYVLCDFQLTCEAFAQGKVKPRTPAEYARTWFPTDPSLVSHVFARNSTMPIEDYIILNALLHRIHVAYIEFHRLMDVRRRVFTDEEGVKAAAERSAAEQEEMATFTFTPEDNFNRLASTIRRAAELTHTVESQLQQACFMWKQYLTIHYQLMRYFWLNPTAPELWTDAKLTASGDEAVKSLYESLYPDATRPISVFMLPNLATTVSRLGWFRETPGDRGEPVAHLLSKVMNKICAVRGWEDISASYIKKNDGIMELMILCTMVSMLRLYPRSDECPTMASALELWHQFTTMTEDTEAYEKWLAENSQLTWFALREHLLFVLQRCHVLHYVLTRFNNVPPVAQSVTRGMDHAIRVYNRHGTLRDAEKNIDVPNMLLTEYYKAEQLKHPIHVHKRPFLDIVWKALCRVFDSNYIHNRDLCYIHYTPEDQLQLMRRYVAKLDPNASTIFNRLHFQHWGIQPATIRLLFACKESHEISSDADHSTESQLKHSLILPTKEFYVLLNLIHIMCEHCSLEPIPLSRETAERQAIALRERLGIRPWEQLSKHDYVTHMCLKCKRVCERVATPCWRSTGATAKGAAAAAAAAASGGSTAKVPKSGGVGLFAESGFANESLICSERRVDNVRFDPLLGHVCRRSTQFKPGSFQERRFFSIQCTRKVHQLYKGRNRVSTVTSLNEAHHLLQLIIGKYCRDTPLTMIPMIGVAWRIGSELYAACETCYSTVKLSLNTIGPHGITCTGHIHDDWAVYRPLQALYPRLGPIPPPFDIAQMAGNAILHNSGFDWELLESLPPDFELFSNAKKAEALALLRKARSVPAGVDPDTYNGAPLSASAARRNGSIQVTLQLGVFKTNAKVGENGLLMTLRNSPELTADSRMALRYSANCYFCNAQRIKSNRPDDRAWVVFAVSDEGSKPVLVFLCAGCKSAVPQILSQGTIPTMSFEGLADLKQKVARQRNNSRFQKLMKKNRDTK